MPLVTHSEPPPTSFSSSSLSTSTPEAKQIRPALLASGTMATDSRIPTAIVDVERISDAMAARLATCLVGHVLFLKSQIPLPVAQLARMSGRSRDPRSAKKLENLLTSFDVLSSHLGSTFTSLSTALSQNSRNYPMKTAEASELTAIDINPQRRRRPAKAHIVFVFGPTVTSALAMKARVVLEIDGLEVRNFGERDDIPVQVLDAASVTDTTPSSPPTSGSENTHSGSHSKSNSLSSLSSTRTGTSGSGVRIPLSVLSSPSGKFESRDDAEEPDAVKQNTEEEDGLEEVPASDSEGSLSEDENEDDEDEDEDEEDDSDSDSQPPTPDLRYDEPTLLSAERLLSRTLALANADPDKGMAAEIAPTQIHILLRAPRRFSHPTWIPRQNLNRVMDGILASFEELEKTPSPRKEGTGANGRNGTSRRVGFMGAGGGKVKTEGVRVSCRGSVEERQRGAGEEDVREGEVEDTLDEMIWWCWDGKLEGLSDL